MGDIFAGVRAWSRRPARSWGGAGLLCLAGAVLGALGLVGGSVDVVSGDARGGRAAGAALLVYSAACVVLAVRLWWRRGTLGGALVLALLILPGRWIDSWMHSPAPRWGIPWWELAMLVWLAASARRDRRSEDPTGEDVATPPAGSSA